MSVLRDTKFIASLSIQYSGAAIGRQVLEGCLTLPDSLVRSILGWTLEVLILLDYLAGWFVSLCRLVYPQGMRSAYMLVFVVRDDLALIFAAIGYNYVSVPTPQTG